MAKNIVVGISGGVDSSVSALLLKQQGYNVTGVFMKNWEEDDNDEYCTAQIDLADARSVCQKIGIPLKTINFSAQYWDRVFEHFLSEYQAGRTPNPDILCNKEIKFKAFLDYAKQLGADAIATGHYAQIREKDGVFKMIKGKDNNKDQTYFLHAIGQAQLAQTIFPIGHLDKSVVREMAEEAGLITSDKKDSTGICFIGERKFKDFLTQYLPHQPGNIEDEKGRIIGRHDGLMYHTIGQRQGLKIGGVKGAAETPWYVAKKDLTRNVLIAVQNNKHPMLFQSELIANQLNWTQDKPPAQSFKCKAKTRYRQIEESCKVTLDGQDQAHVTFENSQRAITPGQSVVFYQEDVCLGGGVIL